MKISRSSAVAFLVALGFAKAPSWDDEKVLEKVKMAPTKVEESDVPEGQEEFYRQMVEAKGNVSFAEGGTEKPAAKNGKAVKKPEAAPEAKPAKKGEKIAKDKAAPAPGEKPVKIAKDKAAVAEPAEKPAAKPAKTKSAPKKPAAPAKVVERDSYGCAKGTIAAEVNQHVSDEWLDEKEIAKLAKVTLDQARGRLYWGAEQGSFEARRLIQYRIKPGSEAKKAKKA